MQPTLVLHCTKGYRRHEHVNVLPQIECDEKSKGVKLIKGRLARKPAERGNEVLAQL